MKIRVALVLAVSLVIATLHAEKISLVGATVINPADGKLLPNATVVIDGDKIERVAMAYASQDLRRSLAAESAPAIEDDALISVVSQLSYDLLDRDIDRALDVAARIGGR